MPILHRGVHRCFHCKKSFNWVHFEFDRQKLKNNMTIESIPSDPKTYRFAVLENGKYEVGINCPHCFEDNRFILSKNN